MPIAALRTAVFTLAVAAPLLAQLPSYQAVRQAASDPAVASLPGGVMLSIPGVLTDFVLAGGGQLVELPNGTARLTGRVFSDSSIYSALLVDLTFTGRLDAGNPGFPPAGAPITQLLPSAYIPVGSVDPNLFHYYTAASGTFTGVRNLDGAVFGVTSTGPIQLGAGANNRNGNPGLVAEFALTMLQQPAAPLAPTGTATLTLDFAPVHAEDTTHPQPDPLRTTLPAGRAMVLPGVGDDYVFVPAGDFTEFGDGHAELAGRLARLSQLDDAWTVSLLLQDRRTPGQPNHPPAGSPVLQLLPSAYVQNGGVLDPAHWHYYAVASGTLTGAGLNAGGSISLTPTHAFQVGGGSNQTNTYFGFHGAFAATITTQPTSRTLTLGGDVELFGLTAVFPVLPFPTLTTPATMPVLDTLTDQGLVLQGDNLAWLELMALNWDLAGGGDARRWHHGYFKVLDNQHVEYHPRPGMAPGIYNCFGFNPAIGTNTIQVQLVAPSSPKLFAEPAVASFYTTHVRLHSGPVVGTAISIVVLSRTFGPSLAPGIASLAIGAGFSDILLDPTIYLHDAATGIAAADYGPIDPALLGDTWWFQGLILDLGTNTLPLPATNPWSTVFD
jgi:hypothetical protein